MTQNRLSAIELRRVMIGEVHLHLKHVSHFTPGELAVIRNEAKKHRGVAALSDGEIRAQSGGSTSTIRRALKVPEGLGLLTVERRRGAPAAITTLMRNGSRAIPSVNMRSKCAALECSTRCDAPDVGRVRLMRRRGDIGRAGKVRLYEHAG